MPQITQAGGAGDNLDQKTQASAEQPPKVLKGPFAEAVAPTPTSTTTPTPVPTPDLVSQVNKTQEQNNWMFNRSGSYDSGSSFWKAFPDVWGGLITSSIPEQTHEALAKYTPQVQAWVAQHTTFGGVSGGLTQLYAKALSIQDPAMRTQALMVADSLSTLPAAQQTLFLTQLNNLSTAGPTAAAISHVGGGIAGAQLVYNQATNRYEVPPAAPNSPVANEQNLTTGLNKVFVSQTGDPYYRLDSSGKVILDERVTNTQVEALYQLFPTLRGKLQFNSGLTMQDVSDSYQNAAAPFVEPYTGRYAFFNGHYLQLDAKGNVQKDTNGNYMIDVAGPKLDISLGTTLAAGVRGLGGGNPLAVGTQILHAAEQEAPSQLKGAVHVVNNVIDPVNRVAGAAMGMAAGVLGSVYGTVYQTVTGQETDQQSRDTAGNLVLIALLDQGQEFSHAGKVSWSTESQAAAGELGLGRAGVSDVSVPQGIKLAIDDSLNKLAENSRFGKLATAAHPLDTLLSPVTRSLAYDIFQKIHSTSLEDWVQGRSWGSRFDRIAALNDQYGANSPAAIRSAFPSIDENLANQLATTDRANMPQATIDWQHTATDGALKLTQTNIITNLANRAKLTKEIDTARAPLDAAQAEFDRVTAARVPANVVDEGINPVSPGVIDPQMGNSAIQDQLFHGGKAVYDVPSDEFLDPEALRGPAHYATTSSDVAGGTIDPLTGEINKGYAQSRVPSAEQQVDSMGEAKQILQDKGYQLHGSESEPWAWRNSDTGQRADIHASASGGFIISEEGGGASNIRPVYHNIQNPLNLDEVIDPQVARNIMDEIAKLDPRLTQLHIDNEIARIENGIHPDEKFYDSYKAVRPQTTAGEFYDDLYRELNQSKKNINKSIEAAGYDGMLETGGGIQGGHGNHQVSMAFHADQVSLGVGKIAPTTEEVMAAHQTLQQAIGDTYDTVSELSAKMDDLNAEGEALRQQAANDVLNQGRPIYKMPGGNTIPEFLHRVLYEDSTKMETLVRKLFYEDWFRKGVNKIGNYLGSDGDWLTTKKQPWLSKLNDKISSDATWQYVQPSMDAPTRVAAQDQNLQITQRLFTRFGVTQEDAMPVMQKLMDAKTQDEFFHVVTQDILGDTGILSKYMPKGVADYTAERVLGISSKSSLDYNHARSVIDAQGSHQIPVLADANGHELPAAPNDFREGIRLPSPNDIEAVLSRTKRWAERAKIASSRSSRGAAYMYDMANSVLRFSTVVQKIPALIFDLPAIILTKTLDETAGNVMTPNQRNKLIPGRNAELQIDPSTLGGVVSGIFDAGGESTRVSDNIATSDILSKGSDGYKAVFQTRANSLIDMHQDPLLAAFARTGLDPVAMRALIEDGGPFQQFYQEQMIPQLMKGKPEGVSDAQWLSNRTDDWLNSWHDVISADTFNNPDFLKLVADGNLGGQGESLWSNGQDISSQYQTLNAQTDAIRTQLADANPRTPAGVAEIRAQQARLKTKLEAINHLEELAAQSNDGMTVLSKPTITASTKQLLADEIRRRFDGNEITLPDITQVDRMASLGGSTNLPGLIGDVATRASNYFYNMDTRFSLKSIGRAEAKFARGAFYYNQADNFRSALLAQGMSQDNALAFSRSMAADLTYDYFYDLTARSTVERQVRNVFWFAPVNGELLYRWLYALPAQSGGLLPGLGLMLAKGEAYKNLLLDLHLIQPDPANGGKLTLMLPGLGNLLNQIPGNLIKFGNDFTLPISSLSSHLSKPIPTMAPLPGALFSTMSQHIPVLRDIANVVAPYSTIQAVPWSIRNLFGMVGRNLPDVSPDYTNQQWNRTHDTAIQMAVSDLNSRGVYPPTVSDFAKIPTLPTDAEAHTYHEAWMKWVGSVRSEANQFARGLYFTSVASSSLIPGSLSTGSAAQRDYEVWFTKNILPGIKATGTISQASRVALNGWLVEHPDSIAYSISYNYYTGKTLPNNLPATDSAYWKEVYTQGAKAHMNPNDYIKFIGAMESYQLLQTRQNAIVQQIAPTGDWTDVVRNWSIRSQAVADRQSQWDTFLKLHPDTNALIENHKATFTAATGTPREGIQAQYVTEVMTAMKALAPIFTGTDGLPAPEFKAVLGQFKALNAQNFTQTAGQQTPMEKGLNDYFSQVITPYMQATKPLYDEAAKLRAAGQDSSAIYAQIDKIRQQYSGLTIDGKKAPGVDEFFYGSESPTQQRYTVTHWQSEPLSWLTPFQRQTAGYTPFKGEDAMWAEITAVRTTVANSIKYDLLSPGSTAYSRLTAWRDNQIKTIGAKYGVPGAEAVTLELANPYVRLQTQGFGANNTSMTTLYSMIDTIHSSIASYKGSPPTGYVDQLKSWAYNYIAQQEAPGVDPKFLQIMERLSYSSKVNADGLHPTGVPLYEQTFFGNFSPYYSPALQNMQTGPA